MIKDRDPKDLVFIALFIIFLYQQDFKLLFFYIFVPCEKIII